MKKTIALAVALAALSWGCTRERVDEYAMVTFMIGDVMKNSAAVQIGDVIQEKDVIQTGTDSFCDIKIGQSLIRVKQKTKVVLATLIRQGGMENTAIDLSSGKMLCKPKKLIKSESFMVKTPTAVAGVRGTQFTVETDSTGTSRIKVFEGSVKVAKRVKELEESMPEVLSIAPDLNKEEKVVITKEDVDKAEKIVRKIMKSESAKGGEAAKEALIKKAGKELTVSKKNIERFAASDFEKDNREIIDIKPKSAEVIREISKAVEEEKEEPRPNGRLLITRFEVYFIQNGKVEWQGSLAEEPVKQGDRIYVASGEYVFCASVDGPVIWRKQVANEGKLQIRDRALVISAQGRETRLDLKTGERL
ncbi:MAG: FecR domain-containing protein [Spirochaetes bacterium]|nr:FecR domain-containing protein [Spirochaetota bacterium]